MVSFITLAIDGLFFRAEARVYTILYHMRPVYKNFTAICLVIYGMDLILIT